MGFAATSASAVPQPLVEDLQRLGVPAEVAEGRGDLPARGDDVAPDEARRGADGGQGLGLGQPLLVEPQPLDVPALPLLGQREGGVGVGQGQARVQVVGPRGGQRLERGHGRFDRRLGFDEPALPLQEQGPGAMEGAGPDHLRLLQAGLETESLAGRLDRAVEGRQRGLDCPGGGLHVGEVLKDARLTEGVLGRRRLLESKFLAQPEGAAIVGLGVVHPAVLGADDGAFGQEARQVGAGSGVAAAGEVREDGHGLVESSHGVGLGAEVACQVGDPTVGVGQPDPDLGPRVVGVGEVVAEALVEVQRPPEQRLAQRCVLREVLHVEVLVDGRGEAAERLHRQADPTLGLVPGEGRRGRWPGSGRSSRDRAGSGPRSARSRRPPGPPPRRPSPRPRRRSPSGADAPSAVPDAPAARARRSPARRPSSARRRRPGPGPSDSGPTVRGPSP